MLSSCLQARVEGWPRSKKIFFAVEHWSYVAGHISDRSSFDKFVAQEKEDELRHRERVAAEEAKGKEVAAEEAMEEKGVAAEDVKQEIFEGREHDVNAAKDKVAGEAKPLPPPDSQSLESWETPPPAKRPGVCRQSPRRRSRGPARDLSAVAGAVRPRAGGGGANR